MNGEKILAVDDSRFLLKALTFVLEKAGYEVHTASDGEEALQKAREERPALILLDAVMPKKDGYAVCREVKGDPDLSETRVIMLTGKGKEVDRERALAEGADGHIAKPYNPTQILEQVKGILG